jgi:hypothetical protein
MNFRLFAYQYGNCNCCLPPPSPASEPEFVYVFSAQESIPLKIRVK